MRIPSFFTRKHKIKKSWLSKDDPQVGKVYLMERSFMGQMYEVTQDLDYLESIARHVCRKRRIEVPPIKVGYKKKVYGQTYDDHIFLSTNGGQNLQTLLHELAHWIVDRKYPETTAHHGPEFVKEYGQLLEDYNIMPKEAFKAICKKYKVK